MYIQTALINIGALAVVAISSQATTTPVVKYAYSECVNNERSLYFYTDEALNCSAATAASVLYKPPIHNLRCDVTCEKGYFLDVNTSSDKPSSECIKCEEGKYSLGGGILYSKATNAWRDPLPIQVTTECSFRSFFSGDWEHSCKAWQPSEDGTMISSGNNSEVLETYGASRLFSTLRITATYVRNGSITFQYRVDAEKPYDGLVFVIDDTSQGKLVSETNGWVEVTHDVAAGSHTFTWEYTKDFANDVGADKADIKVIELVGTSYSDVSCHPCSSGVTMSGGTICAFCKENEYAAPISESELDFKCYSCPENTVAPKGSIGNTSCIRLNACTTEDLVESFSNCSQGTHTITYKWSEPATCKPELTESISLPPPVKDLTCTSCNSGYYYSKKDICETCEAGKYLSMDQKGVLSCQNCDNGRVVVYQQEFGSGTFGAWSEWPTIIDQNFAIQNGWKLTKDGLLLVPTAKKIKTFKSDARVRFELRASAQFTYPGQVNVTYELQNIPTGEEKTVWLEAEITLKYKKTIEKSTISTTNSTDGSKKAIESTGTKPLTAMSFAFEHGHENGVFTEVIPIYASESTEVEISFILYGLSNEAVKSVKAKFLYFGFYGTQEGGAMACTACPTGTESYRDETTSISQCRLCPAGTYSDSLSRSNCAICPANTYSKPGSGTCFPCGSNTHSEPGSAFCSAPSVLVAPDMPKIMYNLSLLQSLVAGNQSSREDNFDDIDQSVTEDVFDAANSLNTTLGFVNPKIVYKLSPMYWMVTGLFRLIGNSWAKNVPGQILQDDTDLDLARPHLIFFEIVNARDLGGSFLLNSRRFGRVECQVPPQLNAWNGGSVMSIEPKGDGSGLTLRYTNGSKCNDEQDGDKRISTTIDFVCDPTVESINQIDGDMDTDVCNIKLTWRTVYACPICQHSFFSEYKTPCSGGKQSITFSKDLACYGGDQKTSIPIRTCNEMVLDSQAIKNVYFAVILVGLVVIVMLVTLTMTYRKYRATYDDYMYLKGKIPTEVKRSSDGNDETVFEFGSQSSGQDTPTEERDDEECEENEAQLQAV